MPSYTHKISIVYRDHRFCDVCSPYVYVVNSDNVMMLASAQLQDLASR